MGRSGGRSGGGGYSHSSYSGGGYSHSSYSGSRGDGSYSHTSLRPSRPSGGSDDPGRFFYEDGPYEFGTYYTVDEESQSPYAPEPQSEYDLYFHTSKPRKPDPKMVRKNLLVRIGLAAPFLILSLITMLLPDPQNTATQAAPAEPAGRLRLEGGTFTEECVSDPLGWVRKEHVTETEMGSRLEPFWEATGVQPYVVLLPYVDGSDDQDARREMADTYFQENIARDDAMLLMFIDASPEGYWEMVCGEKTELIMNAQARDLFWESLDFYWNDLDYSVPDALQRGFAEAGNRVMESLSAETDTETESVSLFSWKHSTIIALLCMALGAQCVWGAIWKSQEKQREREALRARLAAKASDAETGSGNT